MKRILLISDLHFLSVPVGKQEGQGNKAWQRLMEKTIFDSFKRKNLKKILPALLLKIMQKGPFEAVIVNGDLMESRFNERGMILEGDCLAMKSILEKLGLKSGLSERIYVSPGDHELGYRLALSSDPEGGMSLKSLDNFRKTVGPLWQSFKIGKVNFLLLCSSLMIQNFDQLGKDEQNSLKSLREEQKKFTLEFLRSTKVKDKTLVFLHDPDAMKVFDSYAQEAGAEKFSIKIFGGHLHASFVSVIYKLNREKRALFEKYETTVVPAPGGVLGFGGGFLILELSDDGHMEIKKIRI